MVSREFLAIKDLLDYAKTDDLENIARCIEAKHSDQYKILYSREIAKQKLKARYLMIEESKSTLFRWNVKIQGKNYAVRISPEEILPNTDRNYLNRFVRLVNRELTQENSFGLIEFAPFEINQTSIRKVLEKKSPMIFINLGYSKTELERRIQTYLIR
jgi:hypothetical protein